MFLAVSATPRASVARGAVAIWNFGGLATTVRRRFAAMRMLGVLYRRTPSWAFRAFGVWCILFGFGQLMFIYAITHNKQDWSGDRAE